MYYQYIVKSSQFCSFMFLRSDEDRRRRHHRHHHRSSKSKHKRKSSSRSRSASTSSSDSSASSRRQLEKNDKNKISSKRDVSSSAKPSPKPELKPASDAVRAIDNDGFTPQAFVSSRSNRAGTGTKKPPEVIDVEGNGQLNGDVKKETGVRERVPYKDFDPDGIVHENVRKCKTIIKLENGTSDNRLKGIALDEQNFKMSFCWLSLATPPNFIELGTIGNKLRIFEIPSCTSFVEWKGCLGVNKYITEKIVTCYLIWSS